MASVTEWAGSAAKRNCLADEEGEFDTRVPGTALSAKVEDELVWADEPKSLKKKRARKGFVIDDHCLKENANSILKFFEAYVCELPHVRTRRPQRTLVCCSHSP